MQLMQKLKNWKKSNFDSARTSILKFKICSSNAAPSKGRDAAPRQLDVPAAIGCRQNKKPALSGRHLQVYLKLKFDKAAAAIKI